MRPHGGRWLRPEKLARQTLDEAIRDKSGALRETAIIRSKVGRAADSSVMRSPGPSCRTMIVVRRDGTVTRELMLPPDYPALLADLKARVRAARYRVHRVVNTEMLTLYWQIGDAIRTRQATDGWGTKIVDRLAADTRSCG